MGDLRITEFLGCIQEAELSRSGEDEEVRDLRLEAERLRQELKRADETNQGLWNECSVLEKRILGYVSKSAYPQPPK